MTEELIKPAEEKRLMDIMWSCEPPPYAYKKNAELLLNRAEGCFERAKYENAPSMVEHFDNLAKRFLTEYLECMRKYEARRRHYGLWPRLRGTLHRIKSFFLPS